MAFIDYTQYAALGFLDEIAAQHKAMLSEASMALDCFSPSPEVYIQDASDIRLFILPVKWQGRYAGEATFSGDRAGAWRPVCDGDTMERSAPLLRRLAAHPLVVSAMYSLSAPGCEIVPHTDRVEAIGDVWRVHIGLHCPPDCGLMCEGEVRGWRDGGVFMFDSARTEHAAWNRSGECRVIAIIDIDRRLLEGDLVA